MIRSNKILVKRRMSQEKRILGKTKMVKNSQNEKI